MSLQPIVDYIQSLKNVKLSLIVLHLHISLFVNQNVKNCMSSSVHVEASLNQWKPLTQLIKVNYDFLHARSIL